MKRENLINRLVARKLEKPGKRPFCICMYGTSQAARKQLEQPRRGE